MSYSLYPPGTRSNKSWMARGQIGAMRFEVSCRTKDREAADLWVKTFVEKLRADIDRTSPKARSVGDFERWLIDNFQWSEGLVLRKTGGILRFHQAGQGYRSAKLRYGDESKTVLEHRVVFLLVHRWLPESIDHLNRDRGDNRPSNLAPSTPHQQAHNRGKRGTKNLQPIVMQ